MSSLQSKNQEMRWIDVQDQLPRDDEEVWVCVLPLNGWGQYGPPYIQTTAKFRRSYGWASIIPQGLVHYWKPKPTDPELPKWYIEALHDG